MLRLVRRAKLSIFHEFGKLVDRHLLRLTLNEAEALAVQTQFPQLFFPTLAGKGRGASPLADAPGRAQASSGSGTFGPLKLRNV